MLRASVSRLKVPALQAWLRGLVVRVRACAFNQDAQVQQLLHARAQTMGNISVCALHWPPCRQQTLKAAQHGHQRWAAMSPWHGVIDCTDVWQLMLRVAMCPAHLTQTCKPRKAQWWHSL